MAGCKETAEQLESARSHTACLVQRGDPRFIRHSAALSAT